MTKQTTWLCAQRRLRSAWASAQSEQSIRCQHEKSLGHELSNKRTAKTDQTGRMSRLIWVVAWRTVTLLVLSCRGSIVYLPCRCLEIIMRSETSQKIPTYQTQQYICSKRERAMLRDWFNKISYPTHRIKWERNINAKKPNATQLESPVNSSVLVRRPLTNLKQIYKKII